MKWHIYGCHLALTQVGRCRGDAPGIPSGAQHQRSAALVLPCRPPNSFTESLEALDAARVTV